MSPTVKAEIERLIINWGYWKSGGGAIAGGIMLVVGCGDSWGEPRMPLIHGEARYTEQALQLLLEPQRIVLQAHYLTNLRRAAAGAEEESARDRQDSGAEELGWQSHRKATALGISRRTFYRLLTNSQKSFWTAYQLVKLPRLADDAKSLDAVARIRMIPATVG